MGKKLAFKDKSKVWNWCLLAQRPWVKFKTFRINLFNDYKGINKYKAGGSCFGDNAETIIPDTLEDTKENLAMAKFTNKGTL